MKKWILKRQEIIKLLPERKDDSNKGTYGKLLIIAGRHECAGAAILSTLAAMRCGLGMVKVISDKGNFQPLMSIVPEALFSSDTSADSIQESLSWADAALIGPGIGMDEKAEELLLALLKSRGIPLAVDADGLNLISQDHTLMLLLKEKARTDPVILTPHLMEMSRLCGKTISWLKEHREEAATEYSRQYGAVIALKDAITVTAAPDGELIINTTGNNGMSTAGSGDVLSGVIASFLAQGCKALEATGLGVYIHGAAGDMAAARYGVRGMKALDIAESLATVLMQCDRIKDKEKEA